MGGKASRNKFGAKPTEVDGIAFASMAEARRYKELRLLERNGEITQLVAHPSWKFEVNGVKIGRFTPDFSYLDATGLVHVEDVKGSRRLSEAYGLRKKLLLALYGLRVVEIR